MNSVSKKITEKNNEKKNSFTKLHRSYDKYLSKKVNKLFHNLIKLK